MMRTVDMLIEQLQEISKNGYGGALVYPCGDYNSTLSGFGYNDVKYMNGHKDTVVVFHLDQKE